MKMMMATSDAEIRRSLHPFCIAMTVENIVHRGFDGRDSRLKNRNHRSRDRGDLYSEIVSARDLSRKRQGLIVADGNTRNEDMKQNIRPFSSEIGQSISAQNKLSINHCVER